MHYQQQKHFKGKQVKLDYERGVPSIGVAFARFGPIRHLTCLDVVTFDQPNYRQTVVYNSHASDKFRWGSSSCSCCDRGKTKSIPRQDLAWRLKTLPGGLRLSLEFDNKN